MRLISRGAVLRVEEEDHYVAVFVVVLSIAGLSVLEVLAGLTIGLG